MPNAASYEHEMLNAFRKGDIDLKTLLERLGTPSHVRSQGWTTLALTWSQIQIQVRADCVVKLWPYTYTGHIRPAGLYCPEVLAEIELTDWPGVSALVQVTSTSSGEVFAGMPEEMEARVWSMWESLQRGDF